MIITIQGVLLGHERVIKTLTRPVPITLMSHLNKMQTLLVLPTWGQP